MRLGILAVVLISLAGCSLVEWSVKNFEDSFKGQMATFMSYDEDSNVIDKIHSNQMQISAEDMFATTDSEGRVTKASGVLNLTIGKEPMLHIGSSALIKEDGLIDVFDEYAKTFSLDIQDTRGMSFINRAVSKINET